MLTCLNATGKRIETIQLACLLSRTRAEPVTANVSVCESELD